MLATLALIEQAATLLVGLLNILGATKAVSNIIAKQISEGRGAWTDEERNEITVALAASKTTADQQIKDAGG